MAYRIALNHQVIEVSESSVWTIALHVCVRLCVCKIVHLLVKPTMCLWDIYPIHSRRYQVINKRMETRQYIKVDDRHGY